MRHETVHHAHFPASRLRCWRGSEMGRVRKPERGRAAVRLRRILLLAAHPGEGRLTQPTAATQAWGREPLFMPHLRHSPTAARPSQIKSTFRMSRSAAAGATPPARPGIPRRVCWPLCAWTIRATIRGTRPYGLRCLHWDQEECAWRLSDVNRHGWSVTL